MSINRLRRKIAVQSIDENGNVTTHGVPQETSKAIADTPIDLPSLEVIRPNPPIKSDSPFAQRITLPSNGLLYEADITIRPFKVPDVVLMSKALESNNITPIYDAVNNTINVDIRKLCIPDVRYLLYWHRINSYPKRPFTIKTKSLYGNTITTKITSSNLTIENMKHTEALDDYLEKFTWPTIADQEAVAQLKDISPFTSYRAQFVKADSYAEKLESFDALSLEDLADINDFNNLLDFGVRETIKVVDPQFNFKKAWDYLEDRLVICQRQKNLLNASESLYMKAVREEEEIILTELERLKNIGEGVTAKEEIHNFFLEVTDFFPNI